MILESLGDMSELKNITFADGSPIVDDLDLYYEIIGSVREAGYDITLQSLSPGNGVYTTISEFINSLPLNSNSRHKYESDLENFHTVIKNKSMYRCHYIKCGSDNTIIKESQTRSADEPTTIIVICENCDSRRRVQ